MHYSFPSMLFLILIFAVIITLGISYVNLIFWNDTALTLPFSYDNIQLKLRKTHSVLLLFQEIQEAVIYEYKKRM